MRPIVPVLLAAGALAAAGPAAAAAAVRSFPVAGFDKVRNATPFDVRVHVGGAFAARADGSQDVLDRLELTVRDGQLTVGTKPGSWWRGWTTTGRAVVDVSLPALAGAAVSGPGNMNVDHARAPNFVAGVSGPGTLVLGTLEARAAMLAVSGPGDLKVTGRADTATVALSGPGNVHAGSFAARDATVTLSGPGDVRIAGHPRCTVRKSGPGSVRCG